MGRRIALVRHGETDWNAEGRLQGQTDIPLNAAGRLQAGAAGNRLARYDGGWGTLVSSPLGRAVDTAGIIGGHLGLEAITPVFDLQERHYGAGEGRIVAGMARAELDGLLLSAEPERDVVARGISALAGLAHRHRGTDLVVVAHGTLIRLVMGALQGEVHPRLDNAEVVLTDTDIVTAHAEAGRAAPVH